MTLPDTMTAIGITRPGGPDVLEPITRPRPQPGARQVLIEVAYAGVNRHDCGQRIRGTPPPGATDIPGLEVAGTVVATGREVARWQPGDAVCALVNGGGYARYCIAEEPLTLPIPRGCDLRHAAALPEALLTSWLNVFMLGGLAREECLLVHGGSSGVGTIAIQLARVEGARVIATAGSDAKVEACRNLGAVAVNYRTQDYVAEVLRETQGHGADVILDMAGTAYARRNLEALAMDGRVVHLSAAGGDYCVPLAAIMSRRARVTGSLLRGSAPALKTEIVRQVMDRVWPHVGTRIMPVIDSVYPLAQAAAAHARMESGAHIGKILLQPDGAQRH